MLIFWGIFWGAVLGAFWPGYGDLQTYVGGFFGGLVGWTLRMLVRRQINDSYTALRAELVRGNPASSQAATASVGKQGPAQLQDGPWAENTATAGVDTASTTAARVRLSAAALPGAQEAWPGDFPVNAPSHFSVVTPADAPIATAATTVKAPVPPATPNAIKLGLNAARTWLFGGNTIVRSGLVILFIGLSFLARYAAAAGLLPVEFRLAVIAAVGVVLLAVGFRQQQAKPGFALALQGAGVAVMYLTVFAAFRLYGMLPDVLAFGLMAVVCALSCALALLHNSRALAVVAFAGGFAVPVLLSSGQGSHVSLFSYYLLLNLAILFIAHQRAWRILNIVGFLATFGVVTAWGTLQYVPAHYATAQPFLLGFLLIYLLTAILYARNTPTQLGNTVDSTLVFGTPLIAFGLQVGLVRHLELGAAFSALGFAALYLLTATVLARRALHNYRLLIECFIALGVGFATLAVPLALDARWTSAVWALEGAGAFWVGMRQARWMPRAFGLVLQAVAALVFVAGVGNNVSAWPLVNPAFIGAALIALPALMLAWWLRQSLAHSESTWAKAYAAVEQRLSKPLYLYGFGFWCLALALEMNRRMPVAQAGALEVPVFSPSAADMFMLLGIVLSAGLSMQLGRARQWAVATWPSRVTLVPMALTLFVQIAAGAQVLQAPAWWVWPLVLLLHFWMLRQNDHAMPVEPIELAKLGARSTSRTLSHLSHVGGAWLVTWLLADCLWSAIGKGELWQTSWASVVLLISAIGVLLVLVLWAGRANQHNQLSSFSWPLQPHAAAYYWHATAPLVALVFGGALVMAVYSSGRTDPLPYIPLLNPTDLALALALGALVLWRRVVASARPMPAGSAWVGKPGFWVALAALAFVAINTVWLRVAHHFFGVAWNASVLFGSFVVQTGYAILWTLLALGTTVVAGRRMQRTLWLAGAALLGVVVVKLLLIDLSNVGGAERIITFIAVGVLMLVVGYLAPLPPRVQLAEKPLGDVETNKS
jgi:uncharacterized membrane protein